MCLRYLVSFWNTRFIKKKSKVFKTRDGKLGKFHPPSLTGMHFSLGMKPELAPNTDRESLFPTVSRGSLWISAELHTLWARMSVHMWGGCCLRAIKAHQLTHACKTVCVCNCSAVIVVCLEQAAPSPSVRLCAWLLASGLLSSPTVVAKISAAAQVDIYIEFSG